MTTRISLPTSLNRVRARGAPLVWNRPKIAFVSTCPNCGHERAQHGYTRRILLNLLNKRRKIDAYCAVCNVCWPISEGERHAQTKALVTLPSPARNIQQRESREPKRRNNPPESQMSLQQALRTLGGIRRRYELERTAHPDARSLSMHVALDHSDMIWIAAAIEALGKSIAAGATEAAKRAGPSSSIAH